MEAFADRTEAGRQLARSLKRYAGRANPLFSDFRAAAFRSPSKSRMRSTCPSTCFSSASSACPATKSSPWAPSPAAAFAS